MTKLKSRKFLVCVLLLMALSFAAAGAFSLSAKTAQAVTVTNSTMPTAFKDVFGDYTLTTVTESYDTIEELNELRAELGTGANEYNFYFARAEAIIRGNLRFDAMREFSTGNDALNPIEQFGDIASYSTGKLLFYFSSSDIQPTGIYGLSGQEISVYVEADDNAMLPTLILCQSHGEYNNYRQSVYLQRGINKFTMSVLSSKGDSGSAFYLSNPYTPETQGGNVNIYVEGGEFYPLFRQGDDETVFIESVREYEKRRQSNSRLLDFAELQSNRVLITMKSSTLHKAYVQGLASAQAGPEGNLVLWNQYIERMFEFNGIATGGDSPYGEYYDPRTDHVRLNFRYMTMFTGAFAYATNYHLAYGEEYLWFADYNYNPASYCFVLGHELGHILDVRPRTKTENTNNVNALHSILSAMGRFATGREKVPYSDVQSSLFSDYALKYDGFDKTNHMVYWMLESVHPGYWADVNNCYRNQVPYSGLGMNERFVYYSSLVTGVDLSDYFERWGQYLTGSRFRKASASVTFQNLMQNAKEEEKIKDEPDARYWYADERQYFFMTEQAESPRTDLTYNGGKPELSVMIDGTKRKITITSSKDTDFLGYEILSATDGINYKVAGFTYSDSFTDTNSYGTEPTYKVRAFNRYFSASEESAVVTGTAGTQTAEGCRINETHYSSLTAAINAATAGDTIYLLGDMTSDDLKVGKNLKIEIDPSVNYDITLYYSGSKYLFYLTSSLEIRGGEHAKIILDGLNKSYTYGAFFGSSGTLKLYNVIFKDFNSTGNSALTMFGTNFEAENCTFENCSSARRAGVVNIIDGYINSCKFVNCIFKDIKNPGGTDYCGAVALNRTGNSSFESCTFDNNDIADIFIAGNVTFVSEIPKAVLGLNGEITVSLDNIENPGASLGNITLVNDEYGCNVENNKLKFKEIRFALTFTANGKSETYTHNSKKFRFGQEVLTGALSGENQYIASYAYAGKTYHYGDTIEVNGDMNFSVVVKNKILVNLKENGSTQAIYLRGDETLYLPRFDSQNRKVAKWINLHESVWAGSGYTVNVETTFFAVYEGNLNYLYCVDGSIIDNGYANYGQSITLTASGEVAYWRTGSELIAVGSTYTITGDKIFYAVFKGEEDDVFDLTESEIVIDGDLFTYSGQQIKPDITVTIDGIVISAENYSVAYENNVNAGTATITITATGGKATGSKSITFRIAKADRPDFSVALSGWTYGQNANSPSVAGYGNQSGAVTYYYSSSENGNYVMGVPQNAGTYWVKAVMAATQNYNSAEAKCEFTIAKANRTVTATIKGWIYGGQANAPEITWDTQDRTATIQYKSVSEIKYVSTVPSKAGKYNVRITIPETQNYNGKEIVLEFTIEKAERPAFDGQLNIEVDGGKVTLNDIELPDDWQWKNGNQKITDGMTAIAEYVGADKDNYKNTRTQIRISVIGDTEQPAPPDESHDPDDTTGESKPNNDGGIIVLGICIGISVIAFIVFGVMIFIVVRRNKKR